MIKAGDPLLRFHCRSSQRRPCGEVAIPPPIRPVIGSQQWIRYKPFGASESVINFSPAARTLRWNQTCLILLQIAMAPQSWLSKYITQLKQIISSREVTFQGAKPETVDPEQHSFQT
jgi:hypothetical protein